MKNIFGKVIICWIGSFISFPAVAQPEIVPLDKSVLRRWLNVFDQESLTPGRISPGTNNKGRANFDKNEVLSLEGQLYFFPLSITPGQYHSNPVVYLVSAERLSLEVQCFEGTCQGNSLKIFGDKSAVAKVITVFDNGVAQVELIYQDYLVSVGPVEGPKWLMDFIPSPLTKDQPQIFWERANKARLYLPLNLLKSHRLKFRSEVHNLDNVGKDTDLKKIWGIEKRSGTRGYVSSLPNLFLSKGDDLLYAGVRVKYELPSYLSNVKNFLEIDLYLRDFSAEINCWDGICIGDRAYFNLLPSAKKEVQLVHVYENGMADINFSYRAPGAYTREKKTFPMRVKLDALSF